MMCAVSTHLYIMYLILHSAVCTGWTNIIGTCTHTHTHTQETVNLTSSFGIFVRVRAGIDIITRVATWEFQALDPVTGN